MSVIDINQLSYAYPPLLPDGQPVQVLSGIDLTVERGEVLAVMGPTGAGKSTLCLALNGLVPNSTGGVFGGRVTVLGHDTRTTPVAELARHVGIVYQDPDSQLFCANVEDEVAFGPENLAVPPQEIAERVAWALAVVDMSVHRLRSPAALSGGQKQRVAIAAGLAMLPEVLVLDEPTSGLDPQGQHEVWSAIQRLGHERSMTIIMVSQDAEQVAEFAQRVAVLDQGRLLCVDTPERVFADRTLLTTAGLAAPQVAEVAEALNARHGTALRFVRLDAAEAELRHALTVGTPAGGRPS
jgi:energy-coupling factor transporter ATP-binding protein EcfA2